MAEAGQLARELREKLDEALDRLDIARLEREARELEARAADPHFWDDPQEAQRLMRRLADLRGQVETWRGLESQLRDLTELLALAQADGDSRLLEEVEGELEALARRLDELELSLALAGPYDRRDAILAIHAGAGGTDSQDWAQMLLRMYLRWAERRGYEAHVLDISPGEEAGIKSATVEVSGPYAYGWLKAEKGVHRLVRLSPFDAAHARHTSFALVEVLPEVEAPSEVEIRPEDLRIDTFRASGHGGQHVQKNATAVRIVHLPTGITVSCQNERSLARNKEFALKVLKARLLELELEKRQEEQARLKGEHVPAEWGHQVRSYVLHPYKLVKDHRTGYETSDAEGVLDGDLDGFLRAFLKQQLGRGTG
ncbi:MAG TPA: peptide chain release factor 2 [Dehalococcoidia bacterium]|nr:peptide chain release factor 2 [Dehalococcoidia bacterium]